MRSGSRISIAAWSASIIVLMVALLPTRWIIHKPNNPDTDSNNSHFEKIITTVIKSASKLEDLPLEGAVGPESLAFDPNGEGPYAGLSDGRIVKWERNLRRWTDFAFTSPNREECEKPRDHEETEHRCGRPLGLQFHLETGDLYIADAYMGLLVVGPNGGLSEKVSAQEESAPFRFTNGLDIDQTNGLVYFTDSSNRFPRRNYLSGIITGDSTGRLLKYDIKAKRVTVLLENLKFPNGVSLSKDKRFILVAESSSCRVVRYWLNNDDKGPSSRAGQLDVFADLPGFPDNIKRNAEGGYYWVGIYSKRTRFSKWALSRPWIGSAVAGHPIGLKLVSAFVRWRAVGLAVKLCEEGSAVEVLEDHSGRLRFISEVVEREGSLIFGSVIRPSVSVYTRAKW